MTKRRRSCPKGSESVQSFVSWADSYKTVSKWFSRYNLEELLDDNDGLVQLPSFLPTNVAEGALQVVQQIPEVSCWEFLIVGKQKANQAADIV